MKPDEDFEVECHLLEGQIEVQPYGICQRQERLVQLPTQYSEMDPGSLTCPRTFASSVLSKQLLDHSQMAVYPLYPIWRTLINLASHRANIEAAGSPVQHPRLVYTVEFAGAGGEMLSVLEMFRTFARLACSEFDLMRASGDLHQYAMDCKRRFKRQWTASILQSRSPSFRGQAGRLESEVSMTMPWLNR
jgi:hypothetical protein